MQKDTIEYIQNRAAQSETASIKAVSCPDIRALLAERAALIEALENLDNLTNLPTFKAAATKAGYMAQFSTAKAAAYAALAKAPRYRDWETDRKSTRLNSGHITRSRMPSSA